MICFESQIYPLKLETRKCFQQPIILHNIIRHTYHVIFLEFKKNKLKRINNNSKVSFQTKVSSEYVLVVLGKKC